LQPASAKRQLSSQPSRWLDSRRQPPLARLYIYVLQYLAGGTLRGLTAAQSPSKNAPSNFFFGDRGSWQGLTEALEETAQPPRNYQLPVQDLL
jgi:hypothetical protein